MFVIDLMVTGYSLELGRGKLSIIGSVAMLACVGSGT